MILDFIFNTLNFILVFAITITGITVVLGLTVIGAITVAPHIIKLVRRYANN